MPSYVGYQLLEAPRFTHIALVKVIVLSAMFVVALSANSHCEVQGRKVIGQGHAIAPLETSTVKITYFVTQT